MARANAIYFHSRLNNNISKSIDKMTKTIAVDIGNVSIRISPPAFANAVGIPVEKLEDYKEFEL